MFERAIHQKEVKQYQTYLIDVADKLEKGQYISTRTKTLEGLSVETVYEAHEEMENQQFIGKLVIKII